MSRDVEVDLLLNTTTYNRSLKNVEKATEKSVSEVNKILGTVGKKVNITSSIQNQIDLMGDLVEKVSDIESQLSGYSDAVKDITENIDEAIKIMTDKTLTLSDMGNQVIMGALGQIGANLTNKYMPTIPSSTKKPSTTKSPDNQSDDAEFDTTKDYLDDDNSPSGKYKNSASLYDPMGGLGFDTSKLTDLGLIFDGLKEKVKLFTQSVNLSAMATTILSTVTTIGTTVMGAFGAVMTFITSPITLTILGIGLLIAALIYLAMNWDQVKEWAINAWENIQNTWSTVCEWFNTTIIAPLSEIWNWLWNSITTLASNAWEWISGTWNSVCEWFNTTIIKPLSEIWNWLWNSITTLASNAWGWISDTWSSVYTWFKTTIIDPVADMFKTMWNNIKNFAANPLEGIKSMFKSTFNWIARQMNKVIDGLNKFKIPDGIPLVGGMGINIPRIPELWKGSAFTLAGPTLVGEQGPELVSMPRGAAVLPTHKTRSILNGMAYAKQSGVNSGRNVNIQVDLDGKTIARAVGQPLMDSIRVRTGLAL